MAIAFSHYIPNLFKMSIEKIPLKPSLREIMLLFTPFTVTRFAERYQGTAAEDHHL